MSIPKKTTTGGKQKQPLHHTPSSGVAGKTKGSSAKDEGVTLWRVKTQFSVREIAKGGFIMLVLAFHALLSTI